MRVRSHGRAGGARAVLQRLSLGAFAAQGDADRPGKDQVRGPVLLVRRRPQRTRRSSDVLTSPAGASLTTVATSRDSFTTSTRVVTLKSLRWKHSVPTYTAGAASVTSK